MLTPPLRSATVLSPPAAISGDKNVKCVNVKTAGATGPGVDTRRVGGRGRGVRLMLTQVKLRLIDTLCSSISVCVATSCAILRLRHRQRLGYEGEEGDGGDGGVEGVISQTVAAIFLPSIFIFMRQSLTPPPTNARCVLIISA